MCKIKAAGMFQTAWKHTRTAEITAEIMHNASHFKLYSSGYMQSQARQCVVSDLFKLNLKCPTRSKRCNTVLELQNALANAAADMATVLRVSSRQAFSWNNMHYSLPIPMWNKYNNK